MIPTRHIPQSHPHPVLRAALGALAVLLLAFLTPAGAARAQVEPEEGERVAAFIEVTGDILDRAAEAVGESESARARIVLDEARLLHDRSRELLAADRLLLAYRASQRARTAALHAARLARDELGFEERARARAERLRDLYETLLERAQEIRHERALRFLREAERQYLRAEEQYHQHSYEIAFNLLESAETLLRRAGRLLFEAGGAAHLEQQLERTGDLIDRTHERLGEDADPEAVALLVRAEDRLAQAREALQRGEPLRALQLARQARRLALQAGGAADSSPPREAVREQIERFDARRGEVAERIGAAGGEEARRLLERALEHRRQAEERLDRDDREGALRQIKIAHDLLQEAGDKAR